MPRRPTSADPHERVAALYEAHAGRLAAYALRRTGAADAADVVAETFLVAWRRHGEIPDEPESLPWLYGVARKVLANQHRSTDRRGRLHDRLATQFVDAAADMARVEESERFGRVASALARLSDDDAELLRLTAWEGLTPTEIAAVMGLQPNAVRQRLHRARRRLRGQLSIGESDAGVVAPPTMRPVWCEEGSS